MPLAGSGSSRFTLSSDRGAHLRRRETSLRSHPHHTSSRSPAHILAHKKPAPEARHKLARPIRAGLIPARSAVPYPRANRVATQTPFAPRRPRHPTIATRDLSSISSAQPVTRAPFAFSSSPKSANLRTQHQQTLILGRPTPPATPPPPNPHKINPLHPPPSASTTRQPRQVLPKCNHSSSVSPTPPC
jgi:hypothetical protein